MYCISRKSDDGRYMSKVSPSHIVNEAQVSGKEFGLTRMCSLKSIRGTNIVVIDHMHHLNKHIVGYALQWWTINFVTGRVCHWYAPNTVVSG